MTRVPPQNLDAERGVIGSLLLLNAAIPVIAPGLPVEHFYNDAHQTMYAAIVELWARGVRGIDATTLAEALGSRLDDVGGIPYLSQVVGTVQYADHARYYAQIVTEKYHRRQVIYLMAPAVEKAYGDEPVTELARSSAAALNRIAADALVERDISVGAALMEREDLIDRGRTIVSTGLPMLNGRLGGGFEGTQLIVMAGRPGHGKSSLASNMVVGSAQQGTQAHMAIREMKRTENIERMLSQLSGVDGLRIKANDMGAEERAKVAAAANRLNELPITIDDQNKDMAGIMAEFHRQALRGTKLFVLDYLQICKPRDTSESRERQIAEMTLELKDFASDTDSAVVVLSQINREVEKRQGKGGSSIPILSDLRESGAIEQDANVVIFVHLPYKIQPDKPHDEGLIIVAKQRAGPTGAMTARWDKATTTFSEIPVF